MPIFDEIGVTVVALLLFVFCLVLSTLELTPLLADVVGLFCAFLFPVVSGESRDSLLLLMVFTVINGSAADVPLGVDLSTDDEMSGLLLLVLLASLWLELPGEMADFVMTGVGMGKLNISFARVGLRGIVNSLVSNGLRNAFGPCCALELPGSTVVLLIGFDEVAIFDSCCFCRYADNALKSVVPGRPNGGVFDVDALAATAAAAAATADDDGLLEPNALYRLFKYDE